MIILLFFCEVMLHSLSISNMVSAPNVKNICENDCHSCRSHKGNRIHLKNDKRYKSSRLEDNTICVHGQNTTQVYGKTFGFKQNITKLVIF